MYKLASNLNDYKPTEKDVADEPSARLFIPSPSQRSSNYIEALNSIMQKQPPLSGLVNPPSLIPLLSPNLQRTVVDFPRLAHRLPARDPSAPHAFSPCICDSLQPDIKDLHHIQLATPTSTGRRRHLLTTSPDCLPATAHYSTVKTLLTLPITFRPNAPFKISIIYNLTRKALKIWFESYFDTSHTEAFRKWLAPLIAYHKNSISKYTYEQSFPQPDPLPHTWVNHTKKISQAGLCFANSDKGNHLVLSCPILAHAMLHDTMSKGNRYQPSTYTIPEWHARQCASLLSSTGKHYDVYHHPPKMKLQPKDHKTPIKFRPVCSHHHRGAHSAETHLLHILNLISLDIPQDHVVSSTFQSHLRIPSNTSNINSHDVEGMFDNIILDEAYKRIGHFISEAFDRRPLSRINTTHGKPHWSTNTRPASQYEYHTKEQALGLLYHILHEDYCIAGDIIYHSTSGVPMGGRCSSLLSCLCCTSLELTLLPLARLHFPNFFYLRYCDDVICSLSPRHFHTLFDKHFKQIGLKFITSAIEPDGGVPFLESSFHCTSSGLIARHYCKRFLTFPSETDLPHRGSATSIPAQCRQITCSAIRFYRASSTLANFTNSLILQQRRNPTYERKLFSKAFTSIISNPNNRYDALPSRSYHCYAAIKSGTLLPEIF